MLTTIVLYPMLTTVLYYLGYHALVTQWLWKRYPAWLNTWMACPACIGTWYGAAVALAFGFGFALPFLGLPARSGWTVVSVALASCFWTPPLAWLHLAALRKVHGDDGDAPAA